MSEEQQAPDPIKAHELDALLQSAAYFAMRAKGFIDVFTNAGKVGQVRSLLLHEGELRATIATLQQDADAVRKVIASGDAAQARLDGIQREVDGHLSTAKAKADLHLAGAVGQGQKIVADAEAQARKIVSDAQITTAEHLEAHASTMAEKKAEASRLDADIAARQADHAKISKALAELKARIG